MAPVKPVKKWQYSKDKSHRWSYDDGVYVKEWTSHYYDWWPEPMEDEGGYWCIWKCFRVGDSQFGGGGFREHWVWDYA